MAKRFTDTELWDKEWFMMLSQKHKLLIQFLFSKCDVAGVWSPNYVLASSYIGDKITSEDIKLFPNQLEVLPNGNIFIKDFVAFQCGVLSEKCAPHKKIIALLKKYGLYERVSIPLQYPNSTLKDIEEEKEKEKEGEKEKEEGKERAPKTEIIYPFTSTDFFNLWQQWKEYKKLEHNFKYKSYQSEQSALKDLAELSEHDEATAFKIVQISMAKGWKGFFKIENNGKQTDSNGKPILNAAYKQQLAQRMAGNTGTGTQQPNGST